MTLVIATRGIDISVGAVVAIAAAVAALLIGGELVVEGRRADHVSRFPMGAGASPPRSASRRAVRPVERRCWSRSVGMQPIIATLILMVAGRGVAQL